MRRSGEGTRLSELRRDYLEDHVTLVARARAQPRERCPYCRGSEDLVAPAPMVFRMKGDGPLTRLKESEDERVSDWDLKVLPYDSPLLTDEPQSPRELAVPFRRSDPGSGVHYVIVPTPEHGVALSQVGLDRMSLVVLAIQELGKELYQRRGVNYVAVYYEERRDFDGHSLVHVLGLPEVPPAVEREYNAYRRYLKELGTCPLCAIADTERSGPRELLSDEEYISLFPWAPTSPYEAWVLPRSHRNRFYRLTMPSITSLAGILLSTMRAMAQAARDYYMVFYTGSLKRSSMNFHWSARLYGGTDPFQGASLGYGISVVSEPPEDRARALAKHARRALAEILMGDRGGSA
jgi:UDPglucose--hexose-1-phosphate uridylyltransferase